MPASMDVYEIYFASLSGEQITFFFIWFCNSWSSSISSWVLRLLFMWSHNIIWHHINTLAFIKYENRWRGPLYTSNIFKIMISRKKLLELRNYSYGKKTNFIICRKTIRYLGISILSFLNFRKGHKYVHVSTVRIIFDSMMLLFVRKRKTKTMFECFIDILDNKIV